MQLNADHVPNNTHLTHCQMEDYSSLKKKNPNANPEQIMDFLNYYYIIT